MKKIIISLLIMVCFVGMVGCNESDSKESREKIEIFKEPKQTETIATETETQTNISENELTISVEEEDENGYLTIKENENASFISIDYDFKCNDLYGNVIGIKVLMEQFEELNPEFEVKFTQNKTLDILTVKSKGNQYEWSSQQHEFLHYGLFSGDWWDKFEIMKTEATHVLDNFMVSGTIKNLTNKGYENVLIYIRFELEDGTFRTEKGYAPSISAKSESTFIYMGEFEYATYEIVCVLAV